MGEDTEERPPSALNKNKSYANATKGDTEINPIMQEYIRLREMINKNKKNKMEITFKKLEEEEHTRSQYADTETVAEYIFDCLKIKPEDVLEVDFNGHREKKQVLL